MSETLDQRYAIVYSNLPRMVFCEYSDITPRYIAHQYCLYSNSDQSPILTRLIISYFQVILDDIWKITSYFIDPIMT